MTSDCARAHQYAFYIKSLLVGAEVPQKMVCDNHPDFVLAHNEILNPSSIYNTEN